MTLDRMIKSLDYNLVLAVLALILFSLVVIGSATLIFTDESFGQLKNLNIFLKLLHLDYSLVSRQLLWIAIGLVLMAGVIYIPYEDIVKYSRLLYAINIIILVAVLVAGQTNFGAQRWLPLGPFSFQPSEFSKMLMIISLADFLNKRKGNLNKLRDLLPCFFYIGVPMLLILKQPDLGTSLVFTAILFAMLFFTDAKITLLLKIMGAGLILMVIIILTHMYLHDNDLRLDEKLKIAEQRKKQTAAFNVQGIGVQELEKEYEKLAGRKKTIHGWHEKFHKFTLKEYQMSRLFIFLNPKKDLLGDGYQVWQSLISIGSGGIAGKGLLGGTQSHLTFLPVRHSDFIFSVVGEEFGFIGALILLGLFFIIIQRGLKIVLEARDLLGSLLAAGVTVMIAFQVFINIGMTSGIMPVTGIPLPFFSSGGSGMIMNLMSLGILQNVYVRRKKILF